MLCRCTACDKSRVARCSKTGQVHLHRGTEASAQACLTAYGCHSPQAEAINHCKDKEEAKLVHDRGYHAPEESSHLGNCFSPSPSLNRGSLNSSLWQHPESCLVHSGVTVGAALRGTVQDGVTVAAAPNGRRISRAGHPRVPSSIQVLSVTFNDRCDMPLDIGLL